MQSAGPMMSSAMQSAGPMLPMLPMLPQRRAESTIDVSTLPGSRTTAGAHPPGLQETGHSNFTPSFGVGRKRSRTGDAESLTGSSHRV